MKKQKPEKLNKNTQNDFSLGLERDEILPKIIKEARRIALTQNVSHGGGIPTEPQKKFLREVIFSLMKDYAQAKTAGVCVGDQAVVRHHRFGPALNFDNLEKEMMAVMGAVDTMNRLELWDHRTRVKIYENELYRQMGWRAVDAPLEV